MIAYGTRGCPTYRKVIDRMKMYFGIRKILMFSTRFNWYRDSSDWKPFHHDATAYKKDLHRLQNVTVGVSFGAERELAFIDKNNTRLYVPQKNGMLFHFGRDVNINWKHGI